MRMLTATRVATLAVGLSLAAGQAFADPSDGRGHRNNNDNNTTAQPQNANDQDQRRGHRNKTEAPPATVNQTPAVVAPVAPANVRGKARWQNNNNPKQANDYRRGRDNRGVRNNDRPRNWGDNDRRNVNPVVQNNDRRNWGDQERRRHVDVSRFNRNFAAPHRFRVDTYREPYGYSYRRYRYGQHLPHSYYGRNFWLMNFFTYGLFAPPPGYIWVRYGPDALLIDEYTGEIVQVQYDIFYS